MAHLSNIGQYECVLSWPHQDISEELAFMARYQKDKEEDDRRLLERELAKREVTQWQI